MERGSGFLAIVWGVLFLAVCAWLGAWLFAESGEAAAETPSQPESAEPIRLSGIALRREESVRLTDGMVCTMADGERIPTGGTELTEKAGILFDECDGFEYLSPDLAESITVSELEELLRRKPDKPGDARFVTDFGWYYAALADDDQSLPEKGRCTLTFEDMAGPVDAEIRHVSAPEKGRRAIVFRLTAGEDYLKLRKCEAILENGG